MVDATPLPERSGLEPPAREPAPGLRAVRQRRAGSDCSGLADLHNPGMQGTTSIKTVPTEPGWRRRARITILTVSAMSLALGHELHVRAENPKEVEPPPARAALTLVPFAFISKIGGMVGGHSAVADSTYLSRSGLIQVSREDTSGVLLSLVTAQTDTGNILEELAASLGSPEAKTPPTDSTNVELPEYYAPQTVVAYFLHGKKGSVHEFVGEAGQATARQRFFDEISRFIATHKLSPAAPGLYVRAQRLPTSDLQLIKFDLECEESDLLSFTTLKQILENQMALLRVQEVDGSPLLARNVALKAGNPLHIRVGKQAHLIVPYRYAPEIRKP